MEAIVLIFFVIMGATISCLVLGVLGYFDAQRVSRQITEHKIRLSAYHEEIQKLKSKIQELTADDIPSPSQPGKEQAPSCQATSSSDPKQAPISKPSSTVKAPATPPALAATSRHASSQPVVTRPKKSCPAPRKPRQVKPFPWRELLAQAHLLSPDGKSTEANLEAWWTTRIGIVLAVIAAVFFAVHVSQGIPAWLKFAELLGASVLVTGLGHWLSRRNKIDLGNTNIDTIKYGQIIFGGGLAMIFLRLCGIRI